MSALSIPRPGPDETSHYYHGYIAQVPGEHIGNYLAEQVPELERLLSHLDDAAARSAYAPGKWSVKEVVGHLSDVEQIFAYRLLRIARGDATPLPGFDENAYVPAGRFDERPLGALLDGLRAMRAGTIALAQGVPADAWNRRGTASNAPFSARALVYIIVGHTTHHARVLRERYLAASASGAPVTAR